MHVISHLARGARNAAKPNVHGTRDEASAVCPVVSLAAVAAWCMFMSLAEPFDLAFSTT
jgi:hypothetical protein